VTPNQVVGPPLSRPFRSGVSLKGKMLTNADSGLFRDDSHVTVFLKFTTRFTGISDSHGDVMDVFEIKSLGQTRTNSSFRRRAPCLGLRASIARGQRFGNLPSYDVLTLHRGAPP